MKIVVLNGSPRRGGNTELMVDSFIKGATEQGHEVHKVNLGEKKVAPCLACEYCFSHDGVCIQKDDMKEVLELTDGADMIVFASPIYWFTVSAQLKAAIDRLYARARKGFTIRYAALMLDSMSDGVYKSAIDAYEDTCNYLGWKSKGVLHPWFWLWPLSCPLFLEEEGIWRPPGDGLLGKGGQRQIILEAFYDGRN